MLIILAVLLPFFIYSAILSCSMSSSNPDDGSTPVTYPVYINEILSSNSLYPDENGVFCDWVELYNDSDSRVDLSGFALTDNLITVRHTFPDGTFIEPHGYLVVYCSNEVEGDYANFNISKAGGEDILFISAANVTISHVETVPAISNHPMIRTASGEWVLSDYATPGYSNDEAGRSAYIASLNLADTELRITEVMSSNTATIADSDGDFPDYFEITNLGDTAADLGGYFVSDDANNLAMYRLPSVVLEPGETKLIFASGKNKVSGINEIHASFSFSSEGETVCLSSPVGELIHSMNCPSLADDIALIINESGNTETTYKVSPGYPNTETGFESFCSSRKPLGALVINEVMTSNFSYYPQRDGEYYDWIELKNNSSSSINLSDYYLSDNLSIKDMFRLPDNTLEPDEYCIIICSGNTALTSSKYIHANFTLSSGGESLYIHDKNAKLVDYAHLINITYGGSYGRMDSSEGFFYFAKPTPKGDNKNGKRTVTDTPFTKTSSGVYENTDSLTIELLGSGTIRYTTDGSIPTSSSKKYTEPIVITKTTVIRAASFANNAVTGDTATFSYFLNEGHVLPIVSLAADPDDIWSDERGIYVKGNHENYNQDWERRANVSLFETDGSFSIDCGLSLHGAGTKETSKKKSFKLQFRGQYAGDLYYKVFDDSEIDMFSSLILRGGEDYYRTIFRDEMARTLVDEGSDNLLTLNDKYCVLYLNGEYFGLYAIREDYSRDYCAAHMNVSPQSVTIVHGPVYKSSNAELYNLIQYAKDNDMTVEENYRYLESKIDFDSLIDWYIFEAYCGNNDIPGNVRYVKSTEDGDKWKLCFFDMDWAFVWTGTCRWIFAENKQHSALFHALIQNPEFKAKFLTRMAELFNGALSDENVLKSIDYYTELLKPEMKRERAKWGRTVAAWEKSVLEVRNYITEHDRRGQIIKSLKSFMSLSDEEILRYFGRESYG